MLSEEAKERAREMLLGGEQDLAAIQAATSLSPEVVRGLKGALVKSGQLESTRKRRAKPESSEASNDVELSNEEDHLLYILETAKISKKDITGILELVDDYGFDAEGINQALQDQNIRKAIRKKVLTRWAARTGEELPQWLEDELSTSRGPRERGRGQYVTLEQLEERDRKRERKTELSTLSEKVDRLLQGGGLPGRQPGYRQARIPIDKDGNPCHPDRAVSVRYEQIPGGEGGDVQALRREISEMKEKMFSDQITGLSSQVQELTQKIGVAQTDFGAAATALKDVLTSWSGSSGGPLVRAASPLVDAYGRRVLENYKALSNPLTEDMQPQSPEEGTPQNLVERLRGNGLVSTLHRRKGGGR